MICKALGEIRGLKFYLFNKTNLKFAKKYDMVQVGIFTIPLERPGVEVCIYCQEWLA